MISRAVLSSISWMVYFIGLLVRESVRLCWRLGMRVLRVRNSRLIGGDRDGLRWKGRAVVFPTRARFTVHATWRGIRIRRFDLAIGT